MLATDRHLPTHAEVVLVMSQNILYHGRIPVTRGGLVLAMTLVQWELRRPLAGREN